jgi:hypothetical protein
MKVLLANIQDQIKPIDSASVDTSMVGATKSIKATKLRIIKIKSKDGAIIPREATQMVKTHPSTQTEKKEKDSELTCYFLTGVVVIAAILIFIKIILPKIKKSSK